ncbi:hypothetical protein NQ318_018971 [Aromia moschata]|uniref:Secreted protein n=1 Tax=Aromia moschata TaxID=1265417 RepID=A0AAV8ZGR2_9CUCU|nr:hypothetical protein NQ318_018971 [Aromia moschata]
MMLSQLVVVVLLVTFTQAENPNSDEAEVKSVNQSNTDEQGEILSTSSKEDSGKNLETGKSFTSAVYPP